jgi:integrase/recombinase XerD
MESRKAGRPIGSGTNGRKRVLSALEVRHLKKAADKSGLKYGLMIRLILEYAMRVSEATGLRIEDFNGDSRPRQITVRGKKGGFTAVYDMPDKLALRFMKWAVARPGEDSPFVFPSTRSALEPMSPQSVKDTFKALCRRAGISGPRSIHDLRHSSATLMAEHGASAAQIASRLRHRSLSSAAVYIDLTSMKEFDKKMIARYED